MTYNIHKAIKNHSFLIEENVLFLNIDKCEHTYQIFERIFLNVAAKRCVNWQSIYHAKEEHGTLYADLIVCLILIEKYLKLNFKKNDDEVASLLGYDFYDILESYRTFLIK